MDIRPVFQLQTVIKSLKDVIVPALEKDNKLAHEQANLSIAMLNLVQEKLPLWYRFDCDELTRFIELAEKLQEQSKSLKIADRTLLKDLDSCIDAGRDVLSRAKADPSELLDVNFNLREKIGKLIKCVYAEPSNENIKGTETAVIAHAKEQLIRERSWLIAQGWESDPSSIPAIESLIETVSGR